MTDFTDTYGRASKTFRAVMEVALGRHGLHLGQNLVLAALAERDGQTPGEIAAAVHVTTPTIGSTSPPSAVDCADRFSASWIASTDASPPD